MKGNSAVTAPHFMLSDLFVMSYESGESLLKRAKGNLSQESELTCVCLQPPVAIQSR